MNFRFRSFFFGTIFAAVGSAAYGQKVTVDYNKLAHDKDSVYYHEKEAEIMALLPQALGKDYDAFLKNGFEYRVYLPESYEQSLMIEAYKTHNSPRTPQTYREAYADFFVTSRKKGIYNLHKMKNGYREYTISETSYEGDTTQEKHVIVTIPSRFMGAEINMEAKDERTLEKFSSFPFCRSMLGFTGYQRSTRHVKENFMSLDLAKPKLLNIFRNNLLSNVRPSFAVDNIKWIDPQANETAFDNKHALR